MSKKYPQKVCKKCKHGSYSLKKNNICPYCDPEFVIELIKNKILEDNFCDYFNKYCKKYKIKINEDDIDIKNRLIFMALFEKDEKIKKALIKFFKIDTKK